MAGAGQPQGPSQDGNVGMRGPRGSQRRQKSPTLPPLLLGHQIPWEKPRPPAGDREGGTSPPGMSPGMLELFSRLIPPPFPRIPGGLSAPRRAFHSRIPLKTKHCPRCSIGNFPTEPGSPSALGRGTVPALPDPPGDKSWDPARSQPCPRPHPADSHIPNPSWLHPRGAQLASPPRHCPGRRLLPSGSSKTTG